MKKILTFLICIYIFSLIPVKAELTSKQADDLAFFAESFMIEGNKRISSKGFSLLAYGQVPGRTLGFSGKLYYVNKDFKGIYSVNEEKWVFDCSSFVSYVYYHVLGLAFTNKELDTIDPYNNLKLMDPIMEGTNTPYRVASYVKNANSNKHFYYIIKQKKIKDFDYSLLKPGDLITIMGEDNNETSNHIMIYIGNGKIAHASPAETSKPNLGLNIANPMERFPKKIASVIRIKNGIIDPNKKTNLTITWPDNNTTTDFNKLRYANDIPKVSYVLSNTTWTNELELSIILSDEDGISSYSFSETNTPNFIQVNGKKIDITKKILKNSIYYVTVKDILDNEYTEKISISNLDFTEPVVTINEQKQDNSTLITISANDIESGLSSLPYSYSGGKDWTSDNKYEVKSTGLYSIWVKDKAGNTFKKEINIVVNDTIPPEIINIQYGKIIGTKQEVIISGIDSGSGINGYAIKKEDNITVEDDNWEKISVDTYTTYLENGKYYIWIIDSCNNISKYDIINVNFKITDTASNINFTNILLVIVISLILLVISYALFKLIRKKKVF